MRGAFHDREILKDDGGKSIGVNLGYDYCAEHEFGIRGIYRSFGMKLEEKLGFEARKNTITPPGLIHYQKKTSALLYDPFLLDEPERIRKLLSQELGLPGREYEEEHIAGAWDEHSFGLHVTSGLKDITKMLYDAFKSQNGVILLRGSSNPFAGTGLMLLDYTRIPEDVKIKFSEGDRKYRDEQARFRKIEQESGVFDLLKQSGKSFYALSVKRLDDKGQPMWWLNPSEQHKYEAGWYTSEQLKQWAEDKGPVVEKRKDR